MQPHNNKTKKKEELEQPVPSIRSKLNSSPSPEVSELLNEKNRFRSLYKTSGDNHDLAMYRDARRKAKYAVKKIKRQEIRKLSEDAPPSIADAPKQKFFRCEMCNIREPYTKNAYDKHLEGKNHKNMQLFLDYDIWPGKGPNYTLPYTSAVVKNARRIRNELEQSAKRTVPVGKFTPNTLEKLLEKAKKDVQEAIEIEERQRYDGILHIDAQTARSLGKPYCFLTKGDGKICCVACEMVFEDTTTLLAHQIDEGHKGRILGLKLEDKVPTLYYCEACKVFIGHSQVPYDTHLSSDLHLKKEKNTRVLNQFMKNPASFQNPWYKTLRKGSVDEPAVESQSAAESRPTVESQEVLDVTIPIEPPDASNLVADAPPTETPPTADLMDILKQSTMGSSNPAMSSALLETLVTQLSSGSQKSEQAVLIQELLNERKKQREKQEQFAQALTSLATNLSGDDKKKQLDQLLAETQDDSIDDPKMAWVWDGVPPEKKRKVLVDCRLFYQEYEDKKFLQLPRTKPGPTAISRYVGTLAMVAGMPGACDMLKEALPAASEKELTAMCKELGPSVSTLSANPDSADLIRRVLVNFSTPTHARRLLISALVDALTPETLTDFLTDKSSCLIADTSFRCLADTDPLKRMFAQIVFKSLTHRPSKQIDPKARHPTNFVKHVLSYALTMVDLLAEWIELTRRDKIFETFTHPLGQALLNEVLQKATQDLKWNLAESVLTCDLQQFLHMASADHRFVEGCIDTNKGPSLTKLVEKCLENNGQVLISLMHGVTANFVARKLFVCCQDTMKSRISSVLSPQLDELSFGPYSYHLAVKIKSYNNNKNSRYSYVNPALIMLKNE